MQGLSVRLARAINRTIGRSGTVFADRYHARILVTFPNEREPVPVEPPRREPKTWLLRVGWRRQGLLDPASVPGGRG